MTILVRDVCRTFVAISIIIIICGCDTYSERLDKNVTICQEDNFDAIREQLDKLIFSKAESNSFLKSVSAKYLYMDGAGESFSLLNKSVVYLYYDGIKSGEIWTKPGAKLFGGDHISTISFLNGPIKAMVIAHKELEGGRNYFYVVVNNEVQGWMGRPYIHKDKEGHEFYFPNPLTGEKIRETYGNTSLFIAEDIKKSAQTYIPPYESIEWNTSIPKAYRKKGYLLYKKALSDGYSEINRLVSQYRATH